MNWPIALCCGEGFYVVLNGVKLLCSVDTMVLRQDTCKSLIAGIGFYNGLEGKIELRKDRSG